MSGKHLKIVSCLLILLNSTYLVSCRGQVPARQQAVINTELSSPDLNAQQVQHIYREAAEISGLRSLLISQHGRMLGEQYFQHFPVDSLEHVRSVTKSIMSILIGIAVDKGLIPDIDQPVYRYLGKYGQGWMPDRRSASIRPRRWCWWLPFSGKTWVAGAGPPDNRRNWAG